MKPPESGDPCPRSCGGVLRVYRSLAKGQGLLVVRYFECGACKAKPTPRTSFGKRVPRNVTKVGKSAIPAAKKPRQTRCMDTPSPTPDLSDCFKWLSAWELAQWLGVSLEAAMEGVWNGQIPAPRHLDPLVWAADDLNAWAAADCPVRNLPHAGWHFRPSVFLRGKQ